MKWFKDLRKLIRKLRWIAKTYDNNQKHIHARINDAEKIIKERTSIHVDLGIKTHHQIIVAGRYRNHDYVQTYAVQEKDIKYLIEMLRQMEKYGEVERVDGPYKMSACVKHELNWV